MAMERVTQVLATTNEISLKRGNRRWFERKLTENLRSALADLPVAGLERPAWRVLVTFSEPVEFLEVARRMATVFGINSIMPVQRVGDDLRQLESVLGPRLEGLSPATFAVRCTRSDKRFPMTSPEVEREVGQLIKDRTGWSVDLRNPELTVHLLVDGSGVFFWLRKVPGPGGLPVGVSGRGACLLSGGIDSPVAAYLMMKRGMRVDFVHFHSIPRTDPASVEKVHELTAVLNRFQKSARLVTVPLLTVQEQIVSRCPGELRVLLYRRFMLRVAERMAARMRCRALVTGESLGQVSSQTIENLAAVEAVVSLPMLRPLIGFDKQEIIAIARQIGTYEISIQPHTDCCSFLMPDRPATRSSAEQLDEAERELDVAGLVGETVRAANVRLLSEPAPWQEIPVPETAVG